MTPHLTSSSTRRFQPEVELLGARIVPATTVTERNGLLTIVGNDNRDVVIIRDNGGTAPGSVIVETFLNSYVSRGAITRIRVLTAGGNDQVTYEMGANLAANTSRRLFFDLGSGGLDRFRFNLDGNISTGALMALTVLGGDGGDKIQVLTTNDVDVEAGAALNLRLIGGDEQDRISVDFEGTIIGQLSSYADGGPSFDSVRQRIKVSTRSTGQVIAQSRGGSEDDQVSLFARFEAGNAATSKLRLIGGSGFDIGKRTFNVVPVELELDRPIA